MNINPLILNNLGARAALIIADAVLDGPVLGSISYCNVSSSELAQLISDGVLYAGFAEDTGLPGYFSNVDHLTGRIRKIEGDREE